MKIALVPTIIIVEGMMVRVRVDEWAACHHALTAISEKFVSQTLVVLNFC